MAIALTTCATLRGDGAELQRLLDTYDTPRADPFGLFWWRSERFGNIRPADIAGMKGAPEAIRVLIANNCVFEFERGREEVDVFALAAKNGNMPALKVWIDHLKSTKQDLVARLFGAVTTAVRVRRPDVVDFIEKECGFEFDKSEFMFEMFMEGVVGTQLEQVWYYWNWGGFDINMATERFRYGPWHGAVYMGQETPNLQIVKFLLEHGADTNKLHGAKQTRLQVAVKRGNVALAKLLIEHGADISASRLMPSKKIRRPLMHVAVESKSAPMIRLLLEKGLDRVYLYEGRKVEIKGDTVEGVDAEVRLEESRDVMSPLEDESGYVVILGDMVDKSPRVVDKQV